jgi:hypothetical protein
MSACADGVSAMGGPLQRFLALTDARTHVRTQEGKREKPYLITIRWFIHRKTRERGNVVWRSWLRHYATNRKVAGSIPDEVIGFFQLTSSFQAHCGPGVDSASYRYSTRNVPPR